MWGSLRYYLFHANCHCCAIHLNWYRFASIHPMKAPALLPANSNGRMNLFFQQTLHDCGIRNWKNPV
jgi:hypothetical protein